jgi:hypothetical protein
MTYLYIVTAGYDYEGDNVMGVYSTIELAQEEIKRLKEHCKQHFDNYDIETHELDD